MIYKMYIIYFLEGFSASYYWPLSLKIQSNQKNNTHHMTLGYISWENFANAWKRENYMYHWRKQRKHWCETGLSIIYLNNLLKVCKFIFECFQEFSIILTIMSFQYSAVHLAGYRTSCSYRTILKTTFGEGDWTCIKKSNRSLDIWLKDSVSILVYYSFNTQMVTYKFSRHLLLFTYIAVKWRFL